MKEINIYSPHFTSIHLWFAMHTNGAQLQRVYLIITVCSAIRRWSPTTFLNNSVSSRGYESNINWETGEGHPFEYFVYGAACSEVEIDCLTGAHKVSSKGAGPHAALLDTPKFHIVRLSAHHGSPCGGLRIISLSYQEKIEARQLPWCYGWFCGKWPVASLLYFCGPFKCNQERNYFKDEAQSKRSFHVDCWSNQQAWLLMWKVIIWHSWRSSRSI